MPPIGDQIPADQCTQRHPWFQDIVDRHLKIACTRREGSFGNPTVYPDTRIVGYGTIAFRDGEHPRKSFLTHSIVGVQSGQVTASRYCKSSISGWTIPAAYLASRYLVQPVVTDIKDCQIVSVVVGCENHLQVHKSLVESARHCHMHGRICFITGDQDADRR